MKIKIDIDCTPEEARAFLGLPDVSPMQQAVMEQLQAKMEEAAGSFDPETMMKSWFPEAAKGWQDWQKAFWAAAQTEGKGSKSEDD